MSTTILSSATTSAAAVVANPVQSTSSHPTTATNTASNVDVAEGDHHHHDNEDSSSSVGADVASVHSHRSFHSDNEDEDACSEADADGAQTNVDDDTHTQYYETNGSFTHGSIPTTHFGASLPAELMDLSGHGHGFGHSGSPPVHHIHTMFMGTTAPSAPQHSATLADVILCGSDFPVAPTPPSSGHAMPSGSEASRSISAASGASKTLATPAAAPRSPSEEARALEARQTQRRAKIGVRFKTKHCHTFQESGECRYGDSCVFAHGEEELAKYVAIADAAELAAAGGVEGAADVPTAASAPAPSKKTSKSDAVPAKSKVVASSSPVATSASTAPAASVVAPDATTTTNKYRDALMKSVPAPASSTTATAAKPVNTTTTPAINNVVTSSTTPPRSPTSSVPFNSKLTALQLHHHMTQHIPAASDQKRCNDYGFGANVRDERQRASEGNRRVPQEELERYRLERKAEAIARARMSDAGSSASPSPAPEGHNNNDFYMRQASGGFNSNHHQYERSVSSQNSMSEHFEFAAAALVSDSALASPVANDERRFPGMAAGVPTNSQNLDIILNPTSTSGYGTRSNASSTSNGNYYANPNADASAALHGSGSWDYVHRQQPAPKSPGAASGASSGRYSHNPYNVGQRS